MILELSDTIDTASDCQNSVQSTFTGLNHELIHFNEEPTDG